MTTQTSCSVVTGETLWQSRLEACRKEMANETAELREAMNKQINLMEEKCRKLEDEIKEEAAKISKLNLLNKEISFNLSNKNEEYLQLEHALQEQNEDFKKSKVLFKKHLLAVLFKNSKNHPNELKI